MAFSRGGTSGRFAQRQARAAASTALFPAGCLLLVTLLSACDGGPHTPLRVGLLVWPPYELAVLARELGHLDDRQVELVDFESPAVAQRAYRDGAIDAVALTLDYFLEMAAQDRAHRIVLAIDASNGGDALVARRSIASVAELRGRRVGVETSVLGAYMLHRALESAGLTPTDIERVSVDIPDQRRAMRAGEVDAVVTYEPVRSLLIAQGARELFSSREIPGEILDVLITNTMVLEQRRAQLDMLVAGWLKAREHLRTSPDEAAAVMAPREGISPTELLDALALAEVYGRDHNLRLLDGEQPALLPVLRRHVESMRNAGTLTTPLDPAGLLEPGPVRAAAP